MSGGGPLAVHLCRGREWRGGERQVRLLFRTLASRSGFQQCLITARGSTLAREVTGSGPPLHTVPWRLSWDPRAVTASFRCVRRLRTGRRRELVLHAHDSHALLVGLLLARALDLPLVATRRSVTPPGRMWRLPDRVIAISSAVEAALRSRGVPAGRIVRIPSAISLAALARVSAEHLLTEAKPGVPVIVAAGALTPEKDHGTLIEALVLLGQSLPEATLVLVGDGPERPRLEALVRERRVAHRVRFEGERPDALSLIAAAQVFAQPSRREALGTAVLEAMALGTPIVATRTGGLVELLGNGAGLLSEPGDPVTLAESLERVLTDPLLRGALVDEARTRVREYDAPTVADRVAAVYRSALETS